MKLQVREYFEVYSKKRGMVTKSYLHPETFETFEQAYEFILSKYPDRYSVVGDSKTKFIKIYRYPNGVASHKSFKVIKPKS